MEQSKNQKEQRPKRVEELKHFPYASFVEFKKARMEHGVNISIDREAALVWASQRMEGIPPPSSWLKLQVLFLASLTYIVPIGLIIYAIVTNSWFVLIALPVLWIGFFIFHNPYSKKITRSGLILFTFGGLGWGLISRINWLIAITLSLAILFCSIRAIYSKAVNGLIGAALENEDLFCFLWHGAALNINLNNGNSYWTSWKTEGEKNIHYEDKN